MNREYVIVQTTYRLNQGKGCEHWSKGLVTNYGEGAGGLQHGSGGGGKFYPYKKGGTEKVLDMLKGGTTSFGVDFTR